MTDERARHKRAFCMNMPDKNPETKKLISDIVKKIAKPVRDVRLLPPPSALQRFWQRRKLRLAVGVGFVVALCFGVVSILYFSVLRKNPDDIGFYVPRDARVYVEFNLKSDDWEVFNEKSPTLIEYLRSFMSETGVNMSVVEKSSRAGIVGLLDKGKLSWIWLLKSDSRHEIEPYIPPNTYVARVSEDILAVSTDKKSLKLIRGRVISNKRLAGVANDSAMSGYLVLGDFSVPYDVSFKDKVVYSLFKSVGLSGVVSFSAGVDTDGLKIVFGDLKLEDPMLETWNFDDLSNEYDAVFVNANISKSFEYMENALGRFPVAQFFTGRAKSYMREYYGSGWKRVVDMFDAPSLIVARYEKTRDNESVWWHGLRVGIGVGKTFVPHENDLVLFTISNTLARMYPKISEFELPDGTVAFERVADPSYYSFDRDEYNTYIARVPEEDVQIMVRPGKGLYVASNDIEIFKDMASGNVIVPDGFCTQFPETAVMSSNFFENLKIMSDFSSIAITRDGDSAIACAMFRR